MCLETNRYDNMRETERDRANTPSVTYLFSSVTYLFSSYFFFSLLSVESQISEFKYNFEIWENNDCN